MFNQKALKLIAVIGFIFSSTSPTFATGIGDGEAPKTAWSGKVDRGFIVPRTEPATQGGEEGFNVIVEIFQDRKNSWVRLILDAVLNDGNGNLTQITLRELEAQAKNGSSYRSEHTYFISYKDLEAVFKQANPEAASVRIEAGTPLFVSASFESGHQWGGIGRGGVIFVPENAPAATQKGNSSAAEPAIARPTDLDLAYYIGGNLANRYNDRKTGAGLKIGGEVRSRVEAEGKFQILDDADFASAKKLMFELANDPASAQKVLGTEWTVKLEDRYLKKDAAGSVEKAADGYPVPDPMVDTYYDSKYLKAARADMAIRYRWTEGNQTGAWNFKPGIGVVSPEGVVYRVEFGVDATDDKPETIAKFADSDHPLNPFRMIRAVIKGATPSEMFTPQIRITDTRYKFKLTHTSGLIIELSLDDVSVESLTSGKKGAFKQIEMDIDHLATTSKNLLGGQYTSAWANQAFDLMSDPTSVAEFLKAIGKNAFFDGRPALHNAEDLDPESVIRKKRKAEFDLGSEAIVRLRDHLIGATKWVPGAQKYAYSAYIVGLVNEAEASGSVKEVIKHVEKQATGMPARKPTRSRASSDRLGVIVGTCEAMFVTGGI